MYNLVLVSTSKNRVELLTSASFKFEAVAPLCIEEEIEGRDALELTKRRARAKASSVLEKYRNTSSILIGCDTVIEKDGVVFEKPKSALDAKRMILAYSNSSHLVLSSVCCINALNGKISETTSVSRVFVRELKDLEVEDYIKSEEWQGVSGSYRIQGRMGLFIEKIEGSYSGIVGLPLYEFYNSLNSVCS